MRTVNFLKKANIAKLTMFLLANIETYKAAKTSPKAMALDATDKLGFSVTYTNVINLFQDMGIKSWWDDISPSGRFHSKVKAEFDELKRQNQLLRKDVESLMARLDRVEDALTLPESISVVG